MDEFRIDSYESEIPDELKDNEYANKLASGVCAGVQRPSDEQDLENQYIRFLNQPHDLLRMANNMSLDVYGKDNEQRYREYKASFLNNTTYKAPDLAPPTITSRSGYREEVEDFTKLDSSEMDPINQDKIDQAKAFMTDTYWTIIIPTMTLEELEDSWLKFTSMTMKQRRLSDSKSLEIFGCTNQNMYEILKSAFLRKDDLEDNDPLPVISEAINIVRSNNITEFQRTINEIANYDLQQNRPDIIASIIKLKEMDLSGQESIFADAVIKDVISMYNDDNVEPTYMAGLDLPFFDPIEITQMRDLKFDKPLSDEENFEIADGLNVADWWNSYCLEFFGFVNSAYHENSSKWIDFVRRESYRYNTSINEESKKKSADKLKMVGWNPEMEFDTVNRMNAAARTKAKMKVANTFGNTIDLTGFRVSPSVYNEALKTTNKSKMYGKDKNLLPVYIVLVEGKSIFSKIVKKYTKGPFSHAAIGFDSNLEKIYSFNMNAKDLGGRKTNGFSIEGINSYTKNTKIAVYTIFVKEKEYYKMQAMVDMFMGSKTNYNIINLFKLVFNISTKGSLNMICSQFVDNILKIADIDLTGKVSNLVNPNDFFVKAKENKKIYKVYEGKCSEYDHKKVDMIFNRMDSTEKISYVKEQMILNLIQEADNIDYLKDRSIFDESDLMKQVYESIIEPVSNIKCVCETKEFPIQFNKDGDLLIHNISNIDFDAEWDISHRLLAQYEEAGNIEGLKYELSKLWFLSKILAKRIGHKSFDFAKKENMDRRARILNDFNKYMKVVMKLDPEFNFTKYYNNTPFSDATIQIKASTLKYTGEYFKRMIALALK